MVDQKFRIYAKHTVQRFLVRVGYIAHRKYSEPAESFHRPLTHPPKVRERPVVPQVFLVSLLIQKSDIVFLVLCHDIERHFR